MIQASSVEVAELSMTLQLVTRGTVCNHRGHPLTLAIPEPSNIPELDRGVTHVGCYYCDWHKVTWLGSCPCQSICECDMGVEGDFTINIYNLTIKNGYLTHQYLLQVSEM